MDTPGPSVNGDVCGNSSLWAVSDRLHLWTLTTARSHAMLAHFLQHYASLGVRLASNAHVVVHEDFASAATLHAARRELSAAGVQDVSWQPSVNSSALEGLKLERLNDFVRTSLTSASLLIFADVDEFFNFPCDVLARLATSRRQAACSFMQDRLHADRRSLPRVQPGVPMARQFPLCARLRGMMRSPIPGNPMKISLLRGRPFGHVPRYYSAHSVVAGTRRMGGYPTGGGNNCVMMPRFAHYSMTHEAVELSQRKVEDRYANALVTYQRSVAIVQPCQQRARGQGATREGAEAAVPELSDLTAHRRLLQQGAAATAAAAVAAAAHPARLELHRPERRPAGESRGRCYELRDETFGAVPALLMKCGEGCGCRPEVPTS